MSYINILGMQYSIKVQNDGDELRGNSGTAFNLTQRILVSRNQSKEEAVSTLIHEIVEAIFYRLDIDVGEQKEHVIRLLEAGLYQVINDNFYPTYSRLHTILDEAGWPNES
jgi:hypothetical protein